MLQGLKQRGKTILQHFTTGRLIYTSEPHRRTLLTERRGKTRRDVSVHPSQTNIRTKNTSDKDVSKRGKQILIFQTLQKNFKHFIFSVTVQLSGGGNKV